MITPSIKELILKALAEDIGPGDLTTDLLIDQKLSGRAIIVGKQKLVLAGIDVAQEVFKTINPVIDFRTIMTDGSHAFPGDTLAEIKGPVADILKGERLALNFLQHLSGIASLTHEFVRAVEGFSVKIVDTRKTLPGLKALEKYAVRVGGGHNHRYALYDGILIKNNHLRAVPLREAVLRAKTAAPHLIRVEVEVTTIPELREALDAEAECILLDNMDIPTLREAVSIAKGKALLEASGGVNLETVRQIAETGVDLISVGALTHSARACDISLRLKEIC